MRRFTVNMIKRTFRALAYGVVGAVVIIVAFSVVYLDSRPDLEIWHQVHLDEEFREGSPVNSFKDYLALEDRLFAQLDEQVVARVEPGSRSRINRYSHGSLSDPDRWPVNWNRTFEWASDAPDAGVLLIHGMSDSPYSLRSLGKRLHEANAWVVGIRLPGHGTAPSGLTGVRWQDMAAAVQLAVRHLQEATGNKPIYLVGYSNGGGLAVHYAFSALEDPTLPRVDGLVLISPAIGVTSAAAFAVWQARLGHLLGLAKLEWNSIQPEYDPFKYNSFAVNAGDQVYRLTNAIQSRFDAIGNAELDRFPPVLAFQSAVDATVSTPALVRGLFRRLPAGKGELVLFDINRLAKVESVLVKDPGADIDRLMADADLPFRLRVVGNRDGTSWQVGLRSKEGKDAPIDWEALDMQWPRGIYSLSHIALPIMRSDALYGEPGLNSSPGIQLGGLALRGERGVLQISAADMLRLRWNPFYPYIEQRVLEFIAQPE